jgi:hypothetical protein
MENKTIFLLFDEKHHEKYMCPIMTSVTIN